MQSRPGSQSGQGTAAEFFGSMVAYYEDAIRRGVPRYDEMVERLLEYLPLNPRSILELGCGTGEFAERLAKRHPEARLTLVDAAEQMVAATRSRFSDELARAEVVQTRFEDLRADPDRYDLVLSSLSLHHVVDKAALYRVLRNSLRPGGALLFADQLLGAADGVHAVNWERWMQFLRSPGHATEDEVTAVLEHAAAHDHYTPLNEHFRLLEAAGFHRVDCVWRNWIWGIVSAEAAPSPRDLRTSEFLA